MWNNSNPLEYSSLIHSVSRSTMDIRIRLLLIRSLFWKGCRCDYGSVEAMVGGVITITFQMFFSVNVTLLLWCVKDLLWLIIIEKFTWNAISTAYKSRLTEPYSVPIIWMILFHFAHSKRFSPKLIRLLGSIEWFQLKIDNFFKFFNELLVLYFMIMCT